MNKTIAWFAENTVAANLLMLVILVSGLIMAPRITQEVFPEFSTDMITVTVPYLGAAPEEVEEGVCIKIEEQIQSLEGIKKISSTAAEGAGTVVVEVLPDMDVRELLDDIKNRVDAIDTFPEETEKPIIQEVTLKKQVINIAISGPADEVTLKRLGEQIRDELSGVEGITQVELANTRPYEVSIEISEDALRRHGLTFEEVARSVRRSSLDLPGGSVKTRGGEILLRTKGQAYRQRDFEELVLISKTDGTYLTLGDVAHVVDGFAETDQSARFDGNPTALIQVFRVGDQSALDIAEKVKIYVAEAQSRMPDGIRLTLWADDTKILRSRLDLLLRNGYMGLGLVILILALFLRMRLALWVSIGIPISFLGTLWLMPTLDVSINLLSLFAFIVVLGILVDDAIIVGESIHSFQEEGYAGLRSSIVGSRKVAVPVVFGVLTTVAAFSPLIFVEGATGKIWRVIPLIVVPCLLFSLVESLLILPSHLSHFDPEKARKPGPFSRGWYKFQGVFANGLMLIRSKVYQPSLDFALRFRYITVAAIFTLLMLTAGLVAGGRIKFIFLPDVEAENAAAILTMPQGTPVEVTEAAVRRLESVAQQLAKELDGDRSGSERTFRHILSSVGEQPYRTQQGRNPTSSARPGTVSGSHLGEVNIQLAPSEERTLSSSEIARLWRERTGPIADAVELSFTASIFSAGEPVNVQLTNPDLDRLRRASEELKARLSEYPGVYDIADSYRLGKQEIKLEIKPEAEMLGLTLSDLALQVRQAFYGEEAQRIQRGRDEVKVMVRYPEDNRRSLSDLESMRIRTPSGAEVPFSRVAVAEFGRGFSTISRVDRQRAVNVTADVDESEVTSNEIIADLSEDYLPALRARYPGLNFTFEGSQREQRETMESIGRGYLLALMAIFTLLAVPLKSYVQPVIVMSAIPFGLVGAVWGHVAMGQDLTILSFLGIVALAGVVVNDSLVLVHFVNRARADGIPLEEAVREAGALRFRPIILTSLTTFGGLTPLLLEKSLQAQFLIPMAISLAFGVIFSTAIILILVPSAYLILEDLKSLGRRLLGREADVQTGATPVDRPQVVREVA